MPCEIQAASARPPAVPRQYLRPAALVLALACGCAPQPDLRVMTFNIRYGTAADGPNAWPLRQALVYQVLREAEPDVVGFQEALRFQLDEMLAALGEYALIGVGRDDGVQAGEYAAILYRTARLDPLATGTFWFSDTPDVPGSVGWGNTITRICTWARFRDRRTDRTFAVYNVHLDHESQPSRERSTALLVERIRSAGDAAAIVTGDFNAGEANAALTILRDRGFRDSFRVLHPTATTVGTFTGFAGDSTGEKIDYVWIAAGWEVAAASVVRTRPGGRDPSDHAPVVARLRYPKSFPSAQR